MRENIHLINGIEIITVYECPPIPIRHFDWGAIRARDEGEEDCPAGWGSTEDEAIQDLLEKIGEQK